MKQFALTVLLPTYIARSNARRMSVVTIKAAAAGAGGSWTALLVNGGGESVCGPSHPLFQLATKDLGCTKVYALQLPLHGKLPAEVDAKLLPIFDKPGSEKLPLSEVKEALEVYKDAVFKVLEPVVRGKRLLILAYSMGGFTVTALYDRLRAVCEHLVILNIGIGLCNAPTHESIAMFWSVDAFSGRLAALQRVHRAEHIAPMVRMVHAFTARPDWALQPDIRLFSRPDAEVCIVTGTNDEPYPAQPTVLQELEAKLPEHREIWEKRVRVIPDATHFNYFSQAWSRLRPALIELALGQGVVPAAEVASVTLPGPAGDAVAPRSKL